jgi:hypothetical protein
LFDFITLDCSIGSKDHLSPTVLAPIAAFADFDIFWHRTGVLAPFQSVIGAAASRTGRAAPTFRKTLNSPSAAQMHSHLQGCQGYFLSAVYTPSISFGFAAFIEVPMFHYMFSLQNAHHFS